MQFRNFAVINLVSVTVLTLLLWFAIILSPVKWVIFIVFIMLGPLNILAVLGFWGTAGRLFSLRQGKRLFGLVDAGLIVGIIISCYTIPVLLSFGLSSHNIILLSSLSISIAAFFQVLIRKFFPVVQVTTGKTQETGQHEESIFKVFRHDSYTRIMAIFIALSVVTAFFIQYSFMAVTREQYPSAEDMARFLGIFTGSMMIFTLLVKLLVFSYLIRNYGLRICLAISPLLVAVFTAVAVTVGMLMGYTLESSGGFLIFFLLLALSRLFSKALKDSIESPSFKVIYQTISEKIRFRIQSGMDGTVNEIAALSSGLLLAGLGSLSFVKLIHFSWVLFVIIIIWLFIAFRLYKEYRKSIRKALEPEAKEKTETLSEVHSTFKNRFSAETAFRNHYFSLVSGDFSVLENNHGQWYYKKIIDFSEKKSDLTMVPVLERISIDKRLDGEIRKRSADLAGKIKKSAPGGKNDKLASAKESLLGVRMPQTTEILRLLRDSSIESRRTGIFLIGKFKISDMLAEVFECLNIPGLENDALAVLQNFDGVAGPELERFYLASSGNADTGRTILRLLGKSGTKENTALLFSRLWSNSRQVKEIVVKLLLKSGFRPTSEDRDRLHQLISDVVGIMTWNLSAKICLDKSNNKIVLDAMMKESGRWNDFLFRILSITYDAGSISKIRENLVSDTVESVNYALEMIDIVIDDTIKPKLIALLDAVPDEIKIKNLFHFFPGEIPGYDKLLDDIINRDYNLVSVWTKASVLRSIHELEGDDFTESVVALLFSPEKILQEEAARLVLRSSRELYMTVSKRIPDNTKIHLGNITDSDFRQGDLLFEKVMFLSGCFRSILEEELLTLAENMSTMGDKDHPELMAEGFISWKLNGEDMEPDPCINYSEKSNDPEAYNGSHYILPLKAIEEHQYQYPENSFEILNYIDKYENNLT